MRSVKEECLGRMIFCGEVLVKRQIIVSGLLGGVVFSVLILTLYWMAETFHRFSVPLLLIATAAAFFTYLAGYLGIAQAMGSIVARRRSWLASALIGASVLSILLLVPIAGFALFLAAIVLSAGTPAVSGFGRNASWMAGLLGRRPAGPDVDHQVS
jgi:hypothetical protein